MKSFNYTIKEKNGIHARPAGMLCKRAKEFGCEITLEKDGKSVNAAKLMQVMSLGILCGDNITVSATGEDEEAAIAAMEEFFKINL